MAVKPTLQRLIADGVEGATFHHRIAGTQHQTASAIILEHTIAYLGTNEGLFFIIPIISALRCGRIQPVDGGLQHDFGFAVDALTFQRKQFLDLGGAEQTTGGRLDHLEAIPYRQRATDRLRDQFGGRDHLRDLSAPLVQVDAVVSEVGKQAVFHNYLAAGALDVDAVGGTDRPTAVSDIRQHGEVLHGQHTGVLQPDDTAAGAFVNGDIF